MANLAITSTTNSIKVDFGSLIYDNYSGHTFSKGTWNKNSIVSIRLNSEKVEVEVSSFNPFNRVWSVAVVETPECFVVDSVNGVTPTSLSDLYDKLIALIA